jgi:predicted nuclease of predicted toxin-antitoxin system
MRAIVDNNLPLTMTRQARELAPGVDVKHVSELGLAEASDDFLRKKFSGDHVIWISRDEDFWLASPESWSVIWISLHNPKLAFLRDTIAPILAGQLPNLKPGERLLINEDSVLLV